MREVIGGEGAASLEPAARTPNGGEEGGEERRGGGVHGGGAGGAEGGSRATVTEVVVPAAGGDWQGAGQLAAAAACLGVSDRLLERGELFLQSHHFSRRGLAAVCLGLAVYHRLAA